MAVNQSADQQQNPTDDASLATGGTDQEISVGDRNNAKDSVTSSGKSTKLGEDDGGDGDVPDVSGLSLADPNNDDPAAGMHPLHSKWTLWHMNGALVKKDYDKALTRVYDFDTVEEFWRLIRHIKEASELQQESAYSLFHVGIKPAWEDAQCKGGLRYSLQLPSGGRARELKPKIINEVWRSMLLHLIGELFGDDTDSICGAMITLKRGDTWRFEYWLSTTDKENEVRRIGVQMKEILFRVFTDQKDTIGQYVRGMPPNSAGDLQLEFLNFHHDKLSFKF